MSLPQEDIDALRKVAEKRGITMTEALRRAIAMETFLEDAVEDGANLLIEDKNKNRPTIDHPLTGSILIGFGS